MLAKLIFCTHVQTLSKLPEPPQQLCEQSLKRNIGKAHACKLTKGGVNNAKCAFFLRIRAKILYLVIHWFTEQV